MAIYLDEDLAGHDPALVGFPHLLLCMGLLVKTSTALYGVHITNIEVTNETVNGFAAYLTAQGVAPGAMQAVYASANFKVRYRGVSGPGSDLVALWRVEMERINGKIGYRGPYYGFDTAIIDPKDGTYVEYHATPAIGRVRIYYKRNEKLDYTSAVGVPGLVKIVDGTPRAHVGVVKTAATVQPGSNLTELDYATRLHTGFTI